MSETNVAVDRRVVPAAHRDGDMRCIDCWEHGAPFDGPCDGCGYADPRWVSDATMQRFNEHHGHNADLSGGEAVRSKS